MADDPLRIIVEAAGLTIDVDAYHRNRSQHDLADRILTHLGLANDHVIEMRITEAAVEIDRYILDADGRPTFDDEGCAVETLRYNLAGPDR
jgi:hypothetical protein